MTQLRILSQMCQTVNDIEQVRLDLQKLPTSLKFDEIVASIHESQVSVNTHTPLQPIMSWLTKTFFFDFQGERQGEKTRVRFMEIIKSADVNMKRTTKQVLDRSADKVNV